MQLPFIEHLFLEMYYAEDLDTPAQLIFYILHYLLFKE